jgi:hypothetical protein
VLLYQIAKCRNAGTLDLSKDMQDIFDQYTQHDRDGVVRGGAGKILCIGDAHPGDRLDSTTVEELVITPCKDIIEDLRALFRDLYLYVPTRADLSSDTKLSLETKREQDPRVKNAREKLHSSEWVLDVMNKHLASRWDVDDDGSLHKTEIRPDILASMNRRKRKAAESDDGLTFNQRRKGRLPPSSIGPSRSGHVPQGNRTSFTGAMMGQRSRSLKTKGPNGALRSGSSNLRYGSGC